MEAAEYGRLASYEGWYWWYRAQRSALISLMRGLRLPAGARVLDAGCGSGRNLIELADVFAINGHGVDISHHAAAAWHGEAPVWRVQASVNELPYDDGRFDAVFSVDVIGCAGVDPPAFLRQVHRVLKPGGAIVLLAPAYGWLRSRHDDAVHNVRRFNRRQLRELVESADMTVDSTRYLHWPFFPAIVAARLLTAGDRSVVRSDLSPLPGWLNEALFGVARVEQALGRWVSAPFGSTVAAVARKGGT